METLNEVDSEYLVLVGRKIRDRRKDLNLTQERLAELAGISLSYMSHAETGKANASVVVYRNIAAALRMPLVQLLDVNEKCMGPDELMKAVIEIKGMGTREQRMLVKAIKGLISGVRGEEG